MGGGEAGDSSKPYQHHWYTRAQLNGSCMSRVGLRRHFETESLASVCRN